ncbi:UNVERIFIED_CONTAM: hypothetical protein K2H54_037871 [Gekko kuhli]
MNRRTLAFRGGGLVSATAAVGGGGGPKANGNSDPGEAWVRQEAEQLNGQGVEEEVELETVELEVAALEAPDAAGKELLLLPTAPADSAATAPAGPMFAERNRRTLAFRGGGSSSSSANNSCEVAGAAWPRRPLNGRGGGGGVGAAEEEELELEGLLEGKELVQDGGSLSDSTEDEEDGEGGSLGDGSGAEGGSCSSSRRSGGDEAEVSSMGAGEGESVQHFPLAARPKSLLQKLHVSFQGAWLKEFPWLQYCQQTGLMSCAWCAAAALSADGGNSHSSSCGGHDELCKGTRNYKRTLLLRHHVSAEHGLNEPVTAEQGREQVKLFQVYSSYCS